MPGKREAQSVPRCVGMDRRLPIHPLIRLHSSVEPGTEPAEMIPRLALLDACKSAGIARAGVCLEGRR
ncbi:hypothetical protein PT2222_60273 [Paraburkholderia tropica]